jgi:pimeloyl-ACP methyl ester carboxylesterase
LNGPGLATTHWGAGERQALLIHGIQSSAAGWWRLAPDLVELDYTVTAVDLPGHGASERRTTMSIEAFRDAVLGVGSSWDLVLGHSLGGTVALAAMAAVPDWTGRLILEDPSLDSGDPGPLLSKFLGPFTTPITLERIAAENPRWQARDHEIKVDALRQCGPETIEATVSDAAPWNVWDALEAVAVRTLLLGADPKWEPLVTAEVGAEAVAANPNITFAVVADGSHSMHRDAYPAFWGTVSPFVR